MISAQEQYRSIVRHYLQDGQLSPAAQRILSQQRSYLNLLTDEAKAIERSVLAGNFLEGDSEKDDSEKGDRIRQSTTGNVHPAQSASQLPNDSPPPLEGEERLPNRESEGVGEGDSPAKDSLPAQPIPSVEDIAPVQESAPAEAIPAVEDIAPAHENLEGNRPSETQSNEASEQSYPENAALQSVPSLSESENSQIASQIAPDARSRYKAAYSQAIRLMFPLDDLLTLGLRSLQQTLHLQDEDVQAIETRCQDEFEAEQQQYQRNLNLYREEFTSVKFSLHRESVQDELWQLQRKLGLRSEDVLALERDVMRENLEADQDLLAVKLHSSETARGQAVEKELFGDYDFAADRFAQPPQADRSVQGNSPRPHTDPQKIVPQEARNPANDYSDRAVSDQLLLGASRMSAFIEDDGYFADNGQAEQSEGQTANFYLGESDRSTNVISSGSQAGSQMGSQMGSQVSSQVSSQDVRPTVIQDVPQTELELAFQELERHLSSESRDWWSADQTTYQILLKLAPNESLGWLDTASIEQINDISALQRIDRLWSHASQGRFGLYAQREVYKKVEQELRLQYQDKMKGDRLQQLYIQEFVRAIGWWDSRLKFVKFYKWLSFESDLTVAPDVPQGQFPAYWFWVIPSRYALQLGGIGFGQGGWRIDTSRMRAWMNQLRSCKFEPYQS